MTQKQDAELTETTNATKVKFKGIVYYECVIPKQRNENSGLKFRNAHKYNPWLDKRSLHHGNAVSTLHYP
jgi:hypothetical protein